MFGLRQSVVIVPFSQPSLKAIVAIDLETSLRHVAHVANSDPWKEGSQLVKLFALPTIVRVVVTLGALNLNTKKDARHLGRRFLGTSILSHNDRRVAVFFDVAAGCNEVRSDLIPAKIAWSPAIGIQLLRGER